MPNSLLLTVGHLPIDSFNKGYSITGAYRKAFASYLTWEVLSFSWLFNQKTQTERDLAALGVKVENVGLGGVLDYPRQIYMTGIHYSPIYSKSLLFNSKVTYSETSLFFGVGSLNFNQIGYKVMICPGINARYYFSPNSAASFYFRDFFYQDTNLGIVGIMDFGLGIEFKFGGDKGQGSERSGNEAHND